MMREQKLHLEILYLVADQVVLMQLYLLQILWSQVLRTALKAARSPPPRRQRVPYDPFNPSEPPLTIYTEYRFTELPSLSNQPPTSPASSKDNDVRLHLHQIFYVHIPFHHQDVANVTIDPSNLKSLPQLPSLLQLHCKRQQYMMTPQCHLKQFQLQPQLHLQHL